MSCLRSYIMVCHTIHLPHFLFQNKNDVSLWVGINAVSISVYKMDDRLQPIVSFQWSELCDMYFKDNKFTIKQNPPSRSATLRRNQTTTTDESLAAGVIDATTNDIVFFSDDPEDNKLVGVQ